MCLEKLINKKGTAGHQDGLVGKGTRFRGLTTCGRSQKPTAMETQLLEVVLGPPHTGHNALIPALTHIIRTNILIINDTKDRKEGIAASVSAAHPDGPSALGLLPGSSAGSALSPLPTQLAFNSSLTDRLFTIYILLPSCYPDIFFNTLNYNAT